MVLGVGIGLAGLIDGQHGIVRYSPFLVGEILISPRLSLKP